MNVLLSIKPVYSEAILSGAKTYEFNENYFYITFRQSHEYLELARTDTAAEGWYEKWYERWHEPGLTEREIQLLREIKKKSTISIKRLSEVLGIYPSAVQKHVIKLKEKGALKRVGHAKGGHWEVLEND